MTTTPTYRNESLTFGVEIETYVPATLGRRGLAVAIAAAMGTNEVRDLGGYYGKVAAIDGQNREWIIMSDASISGGESAEIVTPPLAFADMDLLQLVIRAAKRAGAKVNESCGVHVHIGAAPFFAKGPQSFRNLVNLWGRFESLALPHVVNRANSRWAAPMTTEIKAWAKDRAATVEGLKSAWYGAWGNPSQHYDSSRYKALNLHNLWFRHGNARTIEFRCFNGTLHAGKVRAYVMLCLAMAGHALAAQYVRVSEKAFDAEWTAYEIVRMFKVIGLARSDDDDAKLGNIRGHLATMGKGHSGHATPAACLKWAIRHGRNVDAIAWPAGFDVAVERARLSA